MSATTNPPHVDETENYGEGMTIAEYDEAIRKLKEDNAALNSTVNELTALCYQVTNHFENEFFNSQSIVRAVRDKLIMTPAVWAIVNKSKEPPEQSVNS